MKTSGPVVILVLTLALLAWGQTSKPQTPPAGSQAQSGATTGMKPGMQQRRAQRMQMRQQHMAAMREHLTKMRTLLEQMKSEVNKMDEKDQPAMRANVELWQLMIDHAEQMLEQRESMPAGPGMGAGMGPGMMGPGGIKGGQAMKPGEGMAGQKGQMPPKGMMKQPSKPAAAATAKESGDAQKLFASHCAMCHGQDARGNTAMGKRMHLSDLHSVSLSSSELTNIIENGKGAMPAFKNKLTSAQVKGLVDYIASLEKGTSKE